MERFPFLVEWVRRARVSDSAAIHRLYQLARSLYRFLGRNLWFLRLGWASSIRSVERVDGGWRVGGWAYHRGTDFGPDRQLRAWLVGRGRRIPLETTTTYDVEARAAARAAEFDYALNSYEAFVPDEALATLRLGDPRRLHVEVRGNRHRVRGPARSVSLVTSAGLTRRRRVDGTLVGPVADVPSDLVFRRDAVVAEATAITSSTDGVTVTLRTDAAPTAARWVCAELGLDEPETRPAELDRSGDVPVVRSERPRRSPGDHVVGVRREAWQLQVRVGEAWVPVVAADGLEPVRGLALRATSAGALLVVWTLVDVVVTGFEVSDDARRVDLEGTWRGEPEFELELRSRFVNVPVEVERRDDGTFSAHATLEVTRWGGAPLPPPIGTYVLVARARGRVRPTFMDERLAHRLPDVHPTERYRLRVLAARRDQLSVRIGPARTEEEFGAWRQQQLRERYALVDVEPLEAVYLESFFGRNATCNPMAIDAEIARLRPDLPRYWGVQDLSFAVPPGAIPVLRGTEDWWRVRNSARWVVSNEWLRANFGKKPFQTVLQTWHGSMYKQIGLDRTGRGQAHLKIVERELAKWDMFVSQAPETTPIIRSAYGLDDQIIEIGYPRNDELFRADDQVRAEVRARLGVPEGARVVMYAPTWREASQEDVQLLDLEELGPILGDGYVLLMRGHVRTLGTGTAASAANVLDVSTYPQINDLLMVADVLITDYSSMMFDYSVTGRPMIFYTPDIDQYTDTQVRGSYFDLEERAPGPVTREVTEVVRLLRSLDTWPAEWTEKYAAWTAMYNSLDDGQASARAVDALFGFRPDREAVRDEDLELEAAFASETEGPPSEGQGLDES